MNTSASGKNASGSIYGGIDGWKYRLSASIEDNDNLKTPKGEMENTYFTARSVSGFCRTTLLRTRRSAPRWTITILSSVLVT